MVVYLYRHYFITFLIFIFITLFSQLFHTHLEMTNVILIHLLPVIVVALRGNYLATFIITTISIAVLAFIYILPTLEFLMDEITYIWSFLIFYIVGFTITFQAKRIHLITLKEILYHTLSHDLKTPLSSIVGNATLLLNSPKSDTPFFNQILTEITESSQRMNRLVSNLLDSARLQNRHSALKKEWCDLEELLGLSLQEFPHESIKHRIIWSIPSHLQLFFGDANLLLRLFVNLLDNAFKYSHSDTPIRITVIPTAKHIQLTFFNESPLIPQIELDRLFDKFYRLDNTADISGSGIGLSICRSIVRAHQGHIKAYNQSNGVCFDVTLPVLKQPKTYSESLA